MAELRQLRVDLKKTRLASYHPGTYQNLQSQWRAYLLLCLYFDFTPVPASENVLCLYVQFFSRTLTVGAICNYLNGVRLFHLFQGIEYPHHSSFPLKLTLLGLAKSSTHTPTQALPITVSVLCRVFHVLHPDTELEWVVYCAALFAFFLIARFSNILPVSTARFDPSHDLSPQCSVYRLLSYNYFRLVKNYSVQGKAAGYPFSSSFWVPIMSCQCLSQNVTVNSCARHLPGLLLSPQLQAYSSY